MVESKIQFIYTILNSIILSEKGLIKNFLELQNLSKNKNIFLLEVCS